MKNAMQEIYGIANITHGAVHTICDRMSSSKYGILNKSNGEFHVKKDKLAEHQVSLRKDDKIIEDFNLLVNNISEYSTKFEKSYSKAETENGLLHFIDLHGIDLLVGQGKAVFDKILKKQDKRLAYVISRYVIDDQSNGGNALDVLNRLAKGNAITNLVSLSGHKDFSGSLKNVRVIIDTPFFYNLLGANNESNKEAAVELMTILKKNGAQFSMFPHNLHEVYAALDDAIQRLQTNDYDIRKSSRLLRMAVYEGLSSTHMQAMRANVESVRSEWNIIDQDIPDMPNGYQDIDVSLLTEIITEAYTRKHTRELYSHELTMLEKDVDSITYTYRIRGNSAIQSLKGCKALMLTTNRIIASTSNDSSINTNKHKIPVCSTDIFLSSILWSNYPTENDQLNRKMLISECYNTIQLDDTLMATFYEDIKKKKLAAAISESQYLELTTSNLALTLLGDKTQNDINAYTDRTSTEILEIIEREHKAEVENAVKEGERKLAEQNEKNERDKARILAEQMVKLSEKDNKISSLQDTVDTTDNICRIIAKVVSGVIMVVISLVLLAGFFAKRYMPPAFWDNHPTISYIWFVVDAILSLWAFLNWMGWIWKYIDLKQYIYNIIYAKSRRVLMGMK